MFWQLWWPAISILENMIMSSCHVNMIVYITKEVKMLKFMMKRSKFGTIQRHIKMEKQ